MAATRLDHLVVAAAGLEEGTRWVEARLGLPPSGGGRHLAMGTHNALWGLGDCYLEVIAVEPGGARPDRPRWFGFDDPLVQARLAQGPCLLTWAVAAEGLAALEPPVPLEPPADFARDDLRWQVRLPVGAALPLEGAWPLTIRWTAGLHPAKRLPDIGLRLERLEIAGRHAAAARDALGPVEGPVAFLPGTGPVRLSATVRTPAGTATL